MLHLMVHVDTCFVCIYIFCICINIYVVLSTAYTCAFQYQYPYLYPCLPVSIPVLAAGAQSRAACKLGSLERGGPCPCAQRRSAWSRQKRARWVYRSRASNLNFEIIKFEFGTVLKLGCWQLRRSMARLSLEPCRAELIVGIGVNCEGEEQPP